MKTLFAGNLPFNTTEQELNDLDREDGGFKREDRGEFRPRRSFRRDGENEERGSFRRRPRGDRDDFRPRGAGEDLSVIQIKAHDKGFTIKQSSLDGKVLDHVTYTPGKPAQVHQTGYKPYPGK